MWDPNVLGVFCALVWSFDQSKATAADVVWGVVDGCDTVRATGGAAVVGGGIEREWLNL